MSQDEQEPRSNSYIASLRYFSKSACAAAPRNRLVEKLRRHSDAELAEMGLERAEIERRAFGQA